MLVVSLEAERDDRVVCCDRGPFANLVLNLVDSIKKNLIKGKERNSYH